MAEQNKKTVDNTNKTPDSKKQVNQQQQNRSRHNNRRGNRRGGQPKKDSTAKRINADNERVSKVAKAVIQAFENKGHNDFGWYNRNPELLRSAATLPFGTIVGGSDWEVPGIMGIYWNPNFGSGTHPIALNQASDSVYSFIVHANSRDYTQTAPDYMVISIAGMQVFSILASVIRAYRTVRLYREDNLYYPDALLRIQGFDPVDMRANLGQIWFDINDFINQVQQIWLPKAFPLTERWFWLNSNVYLDAPGSKAQMYAFVQNRYFEFTEKWATTGSALGVVEDPVNTGSSFSPASKQYPWSTWKKVIQHMIDQIIASEDRGQMYGNILNAYGRDNLYGLAPIGPDEVLEPVYNAEVLLQIENLTVVPTTAAPMALVQIEEDLYPAFGEFRTTKIKPGPSSSVLNFHFPEQPDPAVIVESTRLTALKLKATSETLVIVPDTLYPDDTTPWTPKFEAGTSGQAPKPIYLPEAAGTEIVTAVRLARPSDTQPGQRFAISSVNINATSIDLPETINLMAFDWHPFIYSTSQVDNNPASEGSVAASLHRAYGDFDNFTTLSSTELQKIHTACEFSLWGIPHF